MFVSHEEAPHFHLRRGMGGDAHLILLLRGCIEQRGSVHTDVDAALEEVARLLG